MSAYRSDCPFFYNSICTQGDKCPYRHSEAARRSCITCSFWKSRRCTNPFCTYRHSIIAKNPAAVQCYWESQPGGCARKTCPFKHTKRSKKESDPNRTASNEQRSSDIGSPSSLEDPREELDRKEEKQTGVSTDEAQIGKSTNPYYDSKNVVTIPPNEYPDRPSLSRNQVIDTFEACLSLLIIFGPWEVEVMKKPLVEMFLQCDDESIVHVIIEILFEKSVSGENFQYTAAYLCRYLSKELTESKIFSNFRSLLLTRCKEEYLKSQQLAETPDSMKRLCGYAKFMGELFLSLEIVGKFRSEKIGILRIVLRNILLILIAHPFDITVQCAMQLLERTGETIENTAHLNKPEEGSFDRVYLQIHALYSYPSLNLRSKYMITSVLSLQGNKLGKLSNEYSSSSESVSRQDNTSEQKYDKPQYEKMATAISSELTCPVCLDMFEDPVTLVCMHSYCRQCLQSILESNGGNRLPCPDCRNEVILSSEDLEKLPKNFTIANIVAKYENVEDVPQIPCDQCSKNPPSNAIKSCKECKASYCEYCLLLHSKKGSFAAHSLVEPQRFESQNQKEPLETFCMKCVLVLKYEDDKEYCQHDHPSEIIDIEMAKTKMVNDLLESYPGLHNRNEKYMKEIQATEEIVNNVKRNAKETRNTITDEMKRKCELATEGSNADFQEQIDKIQKHFQEERKKIHSELDIWTNKAEDKNGHYMRRLLEALTDVSDVISKMHSIFQAQASGKDLDLKELAKTYMSVKDVEIKRGPGINLYKGFNVEERLEKVKVPTGVHAEEKSQKMSTGTVKTFSCTSSIRKKDEGASVSVNWPSTSQGARFELKFVEVTKEDTKSSLLVTGIIDQSYTEKRLKHDTIYEVTVSVQDKKSSWSECKRVSTLPGIPCTAFQFSSVVKSSAFELQWDNKRAVYCKNTKSPCKQNTTTTGLQNLIGGAIGTLALRDTFQYWEFQVSFHFRGVGEMKYVAAIGICAAGKIDASRSLARNPFFYGLDYAKLDGGSLVVLFKSEGVKKHQENLKPQRSYNKRIGFFYDPRKLQLTIVDISTNVEKIIYTSDKLKVLPGEVLEYYPACALEEGDAVIELLTGSDIKQIPSCVERALK